MKKTLAASILIAVFVSCFWIKAQADKGKNPMKPEQKQALQQLQKQSKDFLGQLDKENKDFHAKLKTSTVSPIEKRIMATDHSIESLQKRLNFLKDKRAKLVKIKNQ